MRLDFFVAPGGFLGNEHLHPVQEERVEVLSGSLRCRLGGAERTLGRGACVAVPPGMPHTLWNVGEEEAHALVEYRPALRTEVLFETLFGLGRDGKTDEGISGPVAGRGHARGVRRGVPPGPPTPARAEGTRGRAGARRQAPRVPGHRASYPRYSGSA